MAGATLPIAASEAAEVSDPRSDIWLFGLCAIELSTGEPPYSECPSDDSKRQAILSHVMPRAFSEVPDPLIADLILSCLLPFEQRPSAARLRETQLFTDICIGDSTSTGELDSIDSPGTETRRSSGKMGISIEECKQKPEFIALLERQKREREELLQQQEAERRTRKAQWRDRQKQRSLRELLSEIHE
jgi:serine/threonine protein kinase